MKAAGKTSPGSKENHHKAVMLGARHSSLVPSPSALINDSNGEGEEEKLLFPWDGLGAAPDPHPSSALSRPPLPLHPGDCSGDTAMVPRDAGSAAIAPGDSEGTARGQPGLCPVSLPVQFLLPEQTHPFSDRPGASPPAAVTFGTSLNLTLKFLFSHLLSDRAGEEPNLVLLIPS